MLSRPTAPGGEENFSAGVRRWVPLAARAGLIELTELDWSLRRPALDGRGRLVRVMEVPAWRRDDVDRLLDQAPDASAPDASAPDASAPNAPAQFVAADAVPAPKLLVGSSIEVDDASYRTTPAGHSIRWEFSPGLDRLCGTLCVAPAAGARSSRFAQYLLHLNWDLRFIRIGYAGADIALQAVLPSHDRLWVELAEGAFTTICDVLRPQFSWWHQPRWLVDDLFRQVDRGPESERNPI